MSDELLSCLRGHRQVVPHFHLPLQSGSDAILRRMNRQYTRGEFLEMVGRLREGFDRPALTTDIIVGFPGETDERFEETLEVVEKAGFIHIHAFSFSPRPGTAAARWRQDFVNGPVVNERIEVLQRRAMEYSLAFRKQFVAETVEVIVEQLGPADRLQHGRCERYFPVWFESRQMLTGQCVKVRIERVTPQVSFGTVVEKIGTGAFFSLGGER